MFKLPELNYKYNELEPYIDAQTMEIHYTKHHQTYVDKLNDALKDQDLSEKDLPRILSSLDSLPEDIRMAVRNNGGGHWNHSFFWQCMTPGGAELDGTLAEMIDKQFGSLGDFKEKFTQAGVGRFGSGWVWLTNDNGTLKISSAPNQDNPMMNDMAEGNILLGLDVWEHAYYLKYQNKRPDYIDNWWNVVNWQFVSERLSAV